MLELVHDALNGFLLRLGFLRHYDDPLAGAPADFKREGETFRPLEKPAHQ